MPERSVLRRAIRHQLRTLDPSLRVIAEDFLAEASRIDLLAVGAEGELVSVRVGEETDQALLLMQALSDLHWLSSRVADLVQLAPGLGLDPSTDARAMLLCPHFGREIQGAVEQFPRRLLALIRYRGSRERQTFDVQLEPLVPSTRPSTARSTSRRPHPTPSRSATAGPPAPSRLTAPPSDSTFRTGLTDEDIGFEADRRAGGES